MDIKFQDRIDDYLLGRMSEADRAAFEQEVAHDEEKREQLLFTRRVMDSIRSREEKRRALEQMRSRYEEPQVASFSGFTSAKLAKEPTAARPRRGLWLWISGIAAVLVVGFFAVRPVFDGRSHVPEGLEQAPMSPQVRGGYDTFEIPDTVASPDTVAREELQNTHSD